MSDMTGASQISPQVSQCGCVNTSQHLNTESVNTQPGNLDTGADEPPNGISPLIAARGKSDEDFLLII